MESFHAPTWGSSAVLLRCRAVILRCEARCRERGYQQGSINNGRSPQNCIERGCVSVRSSDAILRDDGLICFAYANELKTIVTIVMVADSLVRKKVESSLRVAKSSEE